MAALLLPQVLKELGGSSSCGWFGSGDPYSLFQVGQMTYLLTHLQLLSLAAFNLLDVLVMNLMIEVPSSWCSVGNSSMSTFVSLCSHVIW